MFCWQRHDPEDAFQNRAINNNAVQSEEIWNAEQKKNGTELPTKEGRSKGWIRYAL